MKTLGTLCVYHPGKSTITICHQCRSLICELDLNKARIYEGSQQYDFCFFCYKENQQNQRVRIIGVLIIDMLFLFLFIPLSIQSYNTFGFVIMIISGIFIILMCIGSYININENIREATEKYATEPVNKSTLMIKQNTPNMQGAEAQNFFNQANDTPVIQKNPIAKISINSCINCGHQLSPDDIFCSNCGSRIN